MEDLRKTAREIGVMQQAVNLWEQRDSNEVLNASFDYLPMPSGDMDSRVERIATWLLGFRKNYYLFLTPEIAVVEEMLKQAPDNAKPKMFFVLPPKMDPDTEARIRNNLPKSRKYHPVDVLTEHSSLDYFFPRNTMMVVCGYLGRDHMMILDDDVYRLTVQHCSSFNGRKAFIPYVELEEAIHYEGWMELSREKINTLWRYE